jgi:hypothetical protein
VIIRHSKALSCGTSDQGSEVRTHRTNHQARNSGYKLTSQTTMASWLVPFRPCCVWRHAAALEPLAHILPATRASSSSVISPPPPGSFLPPLEKAPPAVAPSRPPRSLFRHAGTAPAAEASEERQQPMAADGTKATQWSTEWGGNRRLPLRTVAVGF